MFRVPALWRVRVALAVPALLVAVASSGATTGGTASAASHRQCAVATLSGTYLFAGDGFSISGGARTPLAFAGSERFDGAGHVAGTNSFSVGGVVTRRAGFTGTYTLAANCAGTLTIGNDLHFDFYASPSGDQFAYVQTDAGTVSTTTEHRVSRKTTPQQCRTSTLSGAYLFTSNGFSISGSAQTPFAFAGIDRLDGAGTDNSIVSANVGGAITRQATGTGTYTVAADCTGTLAFGDSEFFDLYVSPDGSMFVDTETDPSAVTFETEVRSTSE
jgi:hypothetical protein